MLKKLLIAVPVILALAAVGLVMPAQRVSIEGFGTLSLETPATLSVGSEVAYASPNSIAKAGTDTSGTGTALTLSFSHTLVAGSDRLVVVSIAIENGDTIDVSSVTYGGVAMIKAIDWITGTSGFRYLCEIWYILEADLPSDGSNTVLITASGTASSLEHNGYCAEYTGVEQVAPEATDGAHTSSSFTVTNTISPSDNAWVISAVGAGNVGSFTHGQSQVEVLEFDDTSSTFAVAELRSASEETSLSSTFTGTLNRLCRVAASFTEEPPAPPAGPTYQSVAVASSSPDTASIAVSKPSGTVSGDLLIGVIVTDGNAGTLTSPSSWTPIDSGTADPGGTANQVTLGAWHKIAGGSEPPSYTWSWTNSEAVYAFIIRITGHDVSDPIDVWGVATGSSTGASITVTSPSVNTNVDDTLVLRIFGADRAMNFGSYPTGHTGITFNSSSGDNTSMYQCTGGAAWQAQAATGATGTADFTAIPNTSATEEWRALTVVIAPLTDISNLPSTKDFGVVAASSTPNTGNAYFTITNSSTVTIDIYIKCDGWSPTTGTNSWTYGSPIGADQGFLEASSADGGVGGSQGEGLYDVEILNGIDTLLCDDVAITTNPTWELQLNAPSSFTHGDEQQTIVTLTATAA